MNLSKLENEEEMMNLKITGSKSKRKSVYSTCDQCRKRKIRCSNVVPCIQCLDRGHECTGDLMTSSIPGSNKITLPKVTSEILEEELKEFQRLRTTILILVRRIGELEGKSTGAVLLEVQRSISNQSSTSTPSNVEASIGSSSMGIIVDSNANDGTSASQSHCSPEEQYQLVMAKYQTEMRKVYGPSGVGNDKVLPEIATKCWNDAAEKCGFSRELE